MEFNHAQIQWMGREVHRQKADATFVAGMALAVDYVAQVVSNQGYLGVADIHNINSCVMNNPAHWGFRHTPVTFQNGGSSCSASEIPEAMVRHLGLIHPDGGLLRFHSDDVDPWIKQFLWIHPYEDGNGRTASILRNFIMGTLGDPTDLPDYEW